MAKKFVFPYKGKTDERSIRTKENALEAYLRNLEAGTGTGEPGPIGPSGPAGPAGAEAHVVDPIEPESPDAGLLWTNPNESMSDGPFGHIHIQDVAASTWVIDHTLDFMPNIAVIDSAGEQVEGEVIYAGPSSVTIGFSAAFAGTAYLS